MNECKYHTLDGRCEYVSPSGWYLSRGCMYNMLFYTKVFEGVCQVKKTLDERTKEEERKIKARGMEFE